MFIVVAKGNIDKNASSTTATKQFPSVTNPGKDQEIIENTITSASKKVEELPSSYTCIKYFLTTNKNIFAHSSLNILPENTEEIYANAINEEHEWLQNVNETVPDFHSAWSQFYAAKQRTNVRVCDISAILPLVK